jgi:hypothetical protein
VKIYGAMSKLVHNNLRPEDVSGIFVSTVDTNLEIFAKAYKTLLHRGSPLKPLFKNQPETIPLLSGLKQFFRTGTG